MREPTREEIMSLGWNTIEHDNPTGNLRVLAQQLSQIALLLYDIRAALDERGGEGGG